MSSSLGVSTSDPFLGDIDGSGVLDTADLLLLAGAVGTSPPDPAAADLNGDGRVDILDLAIAARNLGKTGGPSLSQVLPIFQKPFDGNY